MIVLYCREFFTYYAFILFVTAPEVQSSSESSEEDSDDEDDEDGYAISPTDSGAWWDDVREPPEVPGKMMDTGVLRVGG